jgi:hypothetical protein
MPVDEAALAEAWSRSGGRCECGTISHGHDLRCNRLLVWPNRGRSQGRGAWSLRLHANGGQPCCEAVCSVCAARDEARGG